MRTLITLMFCLSLCACAGLDTGIEDNTPITPGQVAFAVAETLTQIKAHPAMPMVLSANDAASLQIAEKLRQSGFTIVSKSSPQANRILFYEITPLARGFLLTVTLDGKQAVRLYGRMPRGTLNPQSAIMISESVKRPTP